MELHGRLVNEIFPELGKFIHDDTLDIMAVNLNTTAEKTGDCLKSVFEPRTGGSEAASGFRASMHRQAESAGKSGTCSKNLNASLKLDRLVKKEEFGIELYMALFGRTVTTLTGRMRSRSPFGTRIVRNTSIWPTMPPRRALFAVCRTGLKVAALMKPL